MAWRVFKPRRSINSSVKNGSKKNIVLEDGELMVVRKEQDGEFVKGVKSDIYIGNGVTTMEELKPAVYGDSSVEPINITSDSSQTTSDALSNVVNGRTLGQLIGSLKRAIETAGSSSIDDFVPATSGMPGASGLVPGPAAGQQNYVLTGSGWKSQAPTAGKANTATFANKDTSSQVITDTYIKNITVYGTTLTYTKGNGNNSTVALQDNNNTYPLAIKDVTANGSSLTFTHYNNEITTIEVSSGGTYSPFTPPTQQLDGEAGLVPAPLAGQQNYILSASGWVEGSSGEADIDYSAVKTKVAKSETNGNINVDDEELVVYNDQEIQAKSSADLPYIFKQDGASISFHYFANEKDILKDYPDPFQDMYGLMPQSLTVTDNNPIRVYLEPYYDNGYDTVWKGGEGRSKVRFTGLIGLVVEDELNNPMFYGDEYKGLILKSDHYLPNTHSPFEITLASNVNLNYGTKYILNGLSKNSSGLYFKVISGSSTKVGTEVVFTGGSNITIKLKGDNEFDIGTSEQIIQPMVRLATEIDDSYVPYENYGSLRGYEDTFILTQTNESLDYSDVEEPYKEFFFDAGANDYARRYYLGSYNGISHEAPNERNYGALYTQQITNGTDIYSIEYYSNDFVMDVGDYYVEAYDHSNEGTYGEGGEFIKRNTAEITGYYRYKLNDNEWVVGSIIPLIGDLFLSRGQYRKDENDIIWYISNSNLSYFTPEAKAAFLNTSGIYSSILDLGLGTRYDNMNTIIFNYHDEGRYDNCFYYSDRDICDMNNWHAPSEGALVIINDSKFNLEDSIFRSGNYIGEVNLYEKTKTTFTLYNYSVSENKKIPIENTNGRFVFCCRPGNALSRQTYNKYLTGDLVELQGLAEQTRLVDYVDNSSLMSNKETIMSIYPKKLITPNEINISFDGQGGFTSENAIAWNESNKKANIVNFSSWSKTASNITINRYYNKGYEEFYNYCRSSSYSSNIVNITLCSNLNTYITNGTPICLATRLYVNDEYEEFTNSIDNEVCYMYLSKTSSFSDSDVIKIKLNNYKQASTIIYNSEYKYLGITYRFNRMGYNWGGSFNFSPIIRKVNSYEYKTDVIGGDTETKYLPYTNINDFGWLPTQRKQITSLTNEDSEYGPADNVKIVITRREINHYNYSDDSSFYEDNNNSKVFIADFSGINFYSIKCPYNNTNYKYFYHLTRLSVDSDISDYNYYSIQDINDYGGTVEIWSNVPIVGIGKDHYYYNPDTSSFVLFDSNVIKINFDRSLFYLHLADSENSYSTYDPINKINYILGNNGSNKWNNGRSNIPRFESIGADATEYATKLIEMSLNNDYYGIKVDLKNHKIYKAYDYIPKFYNEIGEIDSYNESVFNNKLLWEDWKSEYADCRYDDIPAIGEPALFRADKYFKGGSYVDSPCCWDIPIYSKSGNEELSDKDLILPLSNIDFNHIVNIYGVLCGGGNYYNLSYPGTLYMKYSVSGFAYTEDIDNIKYELTNNYLSKEDLDNVDLDFGFEG